MRIAIFSDIHGKLLLPFKLVDLYQKTTGNKVDLILQCGDIGVFPSLEKLDKTTLKHALLDRDELGFMDDFMQKNPTIEVFLESLNINMICVRGNHEDHDYLDNLEAQFPNDNLFPIDIYKRVFLSKSGLKQEFKINNEILTFVGIGRIGDRKGRSEKRFIQDYERRNIQNLIGKNGIIDVLISHDKANMLVGDYGMEELRILLDNIIFKYHFYGHTGEDFKAELDNNGITTSIKIKELEFNSYGVLPNNSMLILEKNGEDLSYTLLDKSFTNQLNKHNWHFK